MNPTNTITLEAFESIIRAILNFQEKQNQFSDDLDKYLDGHFVTTFGSDLVTDVLAALEGCFAYGNDGSVGGVIGWWIWDAPEAGEDKASSWISRNGVSYSVRTIPLLYEYLTTGKTSEILKEDQ